MRDIEAEGVAAKTETGNNKRIQSVRINFMDKRIAWGLVGCLIVVGVGITLVDYRNWRHLETDRYGKGVETSVQLLPVGDLTIYKNDVAGFRIKYPGTWNVRPNPKLQFSNPKETKSWKDVVKMGERVEVVSFVYPIEVPVKPTVTIYLERTDKNLTDMADELVKERLARGLNLMADRQYIRVGDNDMTILIWDEGNVIHQVTLTKRDERIMEMVATANKGKEWDAWAKTFDEMRKNWFIF